MKTAHQSIKTQEAQLFLKWRNDPLYKGKPFITDGVFNEDCFSQQKTKVVFVLKESVAEDGVEEFDLCGAVKDGGISTTWTNIARWTRVILDDGESDHVSWNKLSRITAKDRADAMKKIAAINLKKTYGGPSSDMDEIANYAQPKIWQQMQIYQPDLIVACGKNVAYILRTVSGLERVDWPHTERGIYYWDAGKTQHCSKFTPVIDFHHPQSRIRAPFMAYSLMDAWSELKDKA